MGSEYIPAERHEVIADLLRKNSVVTVSQLKRMLSVSEITIRRDLDILEGKGLLERTRGGAIGIRRMSTEPLYDQKDRSERVEKMAIGKAAATLIEPGDTVLVNSGSTSLQALRQIHGEAVRIITSNVGALIDPPSDPEIMLIGGVYRPRSNSLVGMFASLCLAHVYGNKAIIGVDGISSKYGLTTPIHHEAEVASLMIERTRGTVIVVADHTKIGVVSNFVSARIEAVDILVTDSGFEEEYREELERAGVQIIVAGG